VKAADDRILAAAACKAESVARKQEHLISATKAKASKAATKAKEHHLKLATVTSIVAAHHG
jgi:hypothetical protein